MTKKDETAALQNSFGCIMQQRFIHCNENGVIFYQTYWLTWLACLSKVEWKNPKKDEALSFKKETDPMAVRFDNFSIAFLRKSIKYLTTLMVGHIPFPDLFTSFWRGGKMEAKVYRTKCEESPIPKGGLEIVTQVNFKIETEKKRFLLRLIDLIKENYEAPKSEAHEMIEDKKNVGTGDENNSDDENIMFFMNDEEGL